jgi:hypothetical protein
MMSDPATYHLDPDKVYHSLVQAGEEWADKESAASLYEETKSTVLAELKNQVQAELGEKPLSEAARETKARAMPEYRLHLTQMVAARREANIARVRYDTQKILAELRRTKESTERAKMTLR